MGQAHQGVVDETCCEWMTLCHTHLREMICHQVRDTEKNVRATRCSVFTPPVACTTFADVFTRKLKN